MERVIVTRLSKGNPVNIPEPVVGFIYNTVTAMNLETPAHVLGRVIFST
jgi:hypothetical protein